MKRRFLIAVAAFALLLGALPLGAADEKHPPVNMGAFVAELMRIQMEDKDMSLFLWFPKEFFVEAGVAQSGEKREAAAKEMEFLNDYLIVVAQAQHENPDGTQVYDS